MRGLRRSPRASQRNIVRLNTSELQAIEVEPGTTPPPVPEAASHSAAGEHRYASYQMLTGADLTQQTRALVEEYEAEIERTTDKRLRARLLFEEGRIRERQLTDLRRAARCYQRAVKADPTLRTAVDGLVRAVTRLSRWEELAKVLDRLGDRVPESDRPGLLAERASLLELRVMAPKAARESYEQADKLDAGDAAVALALTLLEVRLGTPIRRSTAFGRLAQVAELPSWMSMLTTWQAESAHQAGATAPLIRRQLEAAIDADAETPLAWARLRQLHRDSGDHEALADALVRDPNLHKDVRLYWAGRVCLLRLGDPERARDRLLEALAVDAESVPTLQLLAEVETRCGNSEGAIERLEQLVELQPDSRARFALHHEAGLLREGQGKDEEAIRHYQHALRLCPTYLRSLRRLGHLYQRYERWPDLVKMHREEARGTSDPTLRSVALRRLGEVLAGPLGQVDDAIDAYEEALRRNPGDVASLRALEGLYRDAGRWMELVGIYHTLLDDAEDDTERASLLERVALLSEHRLGNPAAAINALRQIPEKAPRGVSLLHLQAQLFEREGLWEDLVDVLDDEADLLLDTPRKASLLVLAGETLDRKLNRVDEAKYRYERATKAVPGFLPAWVALSRLHARRGEAAEVLACFCEQLRYVSDAERPGVLCRIGEVLAGELDRAEEAKTYFEEAFELDPSYMPAVHGLHKLAVQSNDVPRLIAVCRSSAERGPDPNSRAVYGYLHGELLWESGEGEQAAAVLTRLIREYSHLMPARELLLELAQVGVKHAPLADLIEREAARCEDETQRVRLLLVLGEYRWRVLEEPVAAAQSYREVLASDDSDPRALLALLLLCAQNDDRAGGTHALQRLGAVVKEPGLRRAFLLRLAVISEIEGHSSDEIIALYREALELAPDDGMARRALERLALVRGDRSLLADLADEEIRRTDPTAPEWPSLITGCAEALAASGRMDEALKRLEPLLGGNAYLPALKLAKRLLLVTGDDSDALARVLERECDLTALREVRSVNQLWLAEDALERLDDAERGRTLLEASVRSAPWNEEAVQRLIAVAEDGGGATELAALFGEVLEEAREDPLTEPATVADLCQRLADMQPADAAGAHRRLALLNEAVQHAPGDAELLLILGEAYEGAGLHMEAAAVYSRLVAGDLEVELLKETHLRLAILWGDQLGDPGRYREHLRLACDLDPSDRLMRRQYIQLLEDDRDWDTMADQLREVVALAEDPEERSDALVELAAVLRQQLDRPEEASKVLRQLLSEDPSAVPDPKDLAVELEASGDWEGLERIYNHLAKHEDTRKAVAARVALARLCVERLDRPDEAREHLDAAVSAQPEDVVLHAQAAAILGAVSGRWREAAQFQHRAVELSGGSPERLRQLEELYRKAKRTRRAEVLQAALRQVLPEEDQIDTGPPAPVGFISSDRIPGWLLHPEESGLIDQLLQAVCPHLAEIYPPDLSVHGDLRPVAEDDSLATVVAELLQTLGLKAVAVARSSVPGNGITVETTEPTTVVLPAGFEDRAPRVQRFELARAFAHLAQGTELSHPGFSVPITSRDLAVLAAATTRLVVPDFGSRLTAPAVLNGLTTQLEDVLPTVVKLELQAVARDYAALVDTVDHARWLESSRQSALRVAVLLTGELDAALAHARSQLPPAPFAELVAFVTSEAFFGVVLPG